jgi:hypothetical protein
MNADPCLRFGDFPRHHDEKSVCCVHHRPSICERGWYLHWSRAFSVLLTAAAVIFQRQLRSDGDAHHDAPAVVFATSFHADRIIAVNAKGMTMKKPLLSIEEPEPKKKAVRADRPPTEGFATIVDGHFKSEFDTAEAAEISGRKLKTAYPMLQVQVYDAAMKVRTLLSSATAADIP